MNNLSTNPIQDKSFELARAVLKAHINSDFKHVEIALRIQIVKSATSIGANVEEAIGAQSKRDFLSKINIAYKEGRETHYWIRLFDSLSLVNANVSEGLLQKCEEVLRILGAIRISTKKALSDGQSNS